MENSGQISAFDIAAVARLVRGTLDRFAGWP
jgi:hypothetical protein